MNTWHEQRTLLQCNIVGIVEGLYGISRNKTMKLKSISLSDIVEL
jgi:hypothetical protein